MSDTINYDKIIYNHNYIDNVICRFDFANPIAQLNKNLPKTINDVVKKYYPIAEPGNILGSELLINAAVRPQVKSVSTTEWVFKTMNRKNKCIITVDSIIFVASEYNKFEDFRKKIIDIVDSVILSYSNTFFRRVGLRYKNLISLTKDSNYFNSKIFSALTEFKNDQTTKLITTLEYIQGNDLCVRLIYGFDNKNYPAPMSEDKFLIDIDAYSSGFVYPDETDDYLKRMHHEDQKCFERIITNNLRDVMNI